MNIFGVIVQALMGGLLAWCIVEPIGAWFEKAKKEMDAQEVREHDDAE